MILKFFGENVRQLRNDFFITQDELSKLTGIDRGQISKIEKGKINATLETIKKIADAFNIKLKDLMDIDYNNQSPKPFVKWAGGKMQIVDLLKKFIPKEFNTYYEPFIGGGALLFSLKPKNAVLNDNNKELISAYKCFMDNDLFLKLKKELKMHEENHSEDYFYKIRNMDKENKFIDLPEYRKASRMIYLNKACFNGLYRVNKDGYFNVPSGKKIKVSTFDNENFNLIKDYIKNNNLKFLCGDFEIAVENATKGDFVYFDPPYDILPDKNGFVSYGKDGFSKDEQIRLANVFKKLARKGVFVMLSNHNTQFINELYKGFNINIIKAKRMINSNASGRGFVEEVVITNY